MGSTKHPVIPRYTVQEGFAFRLSFIFLHPSPDKHTNTTMGAEGPAPSAPPMPEQAPQQAQYAQPPPNAQYPAPPVGAPCAPQMPQQQPVQQMPPMQQPVQQMPPPMQQPGVQAYALTQNVAPPVQGVPMHGPQAHQGTMPAHGLPSQHLRRLPRCAGCHTRNGFQGPRPGATFRCYQCGGLTTLPPNWVEEPGQGCTIL